MAVPAMEILPLFVVLIFGNFDIREAVPTVESMNNLRRILLTNYSKYILPSSDFNQQFVVDILAYPLAIGDIDEIEEELATVLGFNLAWNDTSIKWDPADHDNITNIAMGLNEVWKPDLMLLNPHQTDLKRRIDESTIGLTYSYLGETIWMTMVTAHTTCDIETTYFPFDVQNCMIDFHFAGDETYKIIINVRWSWHEKENGAWKIIRQDITGTNYSHFWIDFQFKRKPLFMLINIFLPIIILALLTPLVFLMPKNSGERLGYSVAMMLAVSMYMTLVSDNLPKNSDPMPMISILIFISLILDALIVLAVITNIQISSMHNNRRIPGKCVRCFVRLTRVITRRNTLSGEGEPRENITWLEVSVAVDLWCLVIFYLFQFILPVVFLIVISN